MARFVVKRTATGVKFDLRAGNGEIIAQSEVYVTMAGCMKGLISVALNAPDAALADLTAEVPAKVRNPKFEVYLDKSGQFRFRLKARNGQIIAVSEAYRTRRGCLNGVESVRKNAARAVLDAAGMNDADEK